MSDETVIVKGRGTIFLGGPPLVKAATGEEVTAEELGGADVHCRISRRGRPLRRRTTTHALEWARDIVGRLHRAQGAALGPRGARGAALRSPRSSRGIVPREPAQGLRRPRGHRPHRGRQPLQRVQGPLRGHPGLRASRASWAIPWASSPTRGALLRERAQGHALHRDVLPAQGSPSSSSRTSRASSWARSTSSKGIAKDGAKMVHAVANAQVPKFTVIIGGSFGAGNYGMCGRAYEPRQLWMWPNARISVMGGEQAASVLTQVKQEQRERQGKPMTAEESRRHRGAHPRQVRGGGQPLLLDRAPVGRRRDPPRGHAHRARPRPRPPRSTRPFPRRASACFGCKGLARRLRLNPRPPLVVS